VNTNKSAVRIPNKLFGTSGIRGTIDEFLTPEFAHKAGLAYATLLGNKGVVLVGRDVRFNSQLIQITLMSGLLAGGVEVIDCGVVPTPALLFALKKEGFTAAVSVTGSHNPPEMTGMLFFLSDSGELDQIAENEFERIFQLERWRGLSRRKAGSLRSLDITETYLNELQKQLGNVGGYRVVVDPGNGAAFQTLRVALQRQGCEVLTINGTPDGRFPARSPYPQPSTLSQLSKAVQEGKADLGVGTDSDGDRALFVTESGEVLWGDVTGALFARDELRRGGGGRIITTVNTSSLIQLLCQEYGGKVTVTRVGPPAMVEALRSHDDAIFAVEESGKYIWPKILLYGDAALAAGKLLQIMKRENKTLEELQCDLPRLHRLKGTVPCADELKSKALEAAQEMWKEEETDAKVLTIDGLRVSYPDFSWFLLRASGTEPVLRCYGEGRSIEDARRLLGVATGLAQRSIEKARQA
jgi:phosphomannomutase/phosphoglucomutase